MDSKIELSRDFKIPADLAESEIARTIYALGAMAFSYAVTERFKEAGEQFAIDHDTRKFITSMPSVLAQVVLQVEAMQRGDEGTTSKSVKEQLASHEESGS